MRFAVAMAASLGIVLGSAVLSPDSLAVASAASEYITAAQQPEPSGQAQIDVDVNRGGGGWWASPVWIAIGVVAVLLVIAIIAMAARGGGTTVIKD
jgi:hypothetical protein